MSAFHRGGHYAALDGGSVTLALATAVDHPLPGEVVVGIKTADVDAATKAIEASGGAIVKGPYNDAHERRAVVYDTKATAWSSTAHCPVEPLLSVSAAWQTPSHGQMPVAISAP
jgi:hypothetical protein